MSPNSEQPDSAWQNRLGRVLLGLALVSASAFLFVDGWNAPLLLDEHVSYWIAGTNNPGTLMQRSLEYSATPPLTFLFQQALLSEPQPQPYQLRLVSWLGFLLGIGCVYLIGRELQGSTFGGAVALLLAWNPAILDSMRVGRPYGLSVGLSALSVWAMVKLFDHPLSWTRAGILGISQALLIWTHYVNLPLVCIQLLLLLLDGLTFRLPDKECTSRSAILICFGIVGLSIVPLLPSILRIQELSVYLNSRVDPVNFFEAFHPLWRIGGPVGLIAMFAMSYGKKPARSHATPHRDHVLRSLSWMSVVPILAMWGASYWWEPTLGEVRYRAVYSPILALAVCIVCYRLSKSTERVVFGIVLILSIGWIAEGTVPWRSVALSDPAAKDWQTMAEIINEHDAEANPIFVYGGLIESRLMNALYADSMFVDYVCSRMGRFRIKQELIRLAIPYKVSMVAEVKAQYLEQIAIARQHSRSIWLAVGMDTDLGQLAQREYSELILREGFEIEERYEYATAQLIQFRPIDLNPNKTTNNAP